jgi:hypothetical protein
MMFYSETVCYVGRYWPFYYNGDQHYFMGSAQSCLIIDMLC